MNKKIDNMGRISIPIQMRKELSLKVGDEVKVEVKNKEIILSNPDTFDLKEYVEGRLKQAEEMGNHDLITAYYDVLRKLEEA